jgi:hypothetical protein
MSGRIAIVTDGESWFVRRIASAEHDLSNDEKVYRCDVPIGGRFATLDDAAAMAKEYLLTQKLG